MPAPTMSDIVIPHIGEHKATVIFMHGLGDSGKGWERQCRTLQQSMPGVKFILPSAPTISVTMLGGRQMPAWWNILGLADRKQEPCDGIEESRVRIEAILEAEKTAPKRFLAGFSQGGAITFYVGLQYKTPLSGLIGLSTFLPKPFALEGKTAVQKNVPILMCHGTVDKMITPERAKESRQIMEALGHKVEFHEYPMAHEVHPQEFELLTQWLKQHIY